MARTLRVADEIGIVAIDVWAKTDRARAFHERYAFQALSNDDLHLYLPLETVCRVLAP